MKVCDSGLLVFDRYKDDHQCKNKDDNLCQEEDDLYRMTSWELKELNLQPGQNKGKFVTDDLDILIDFNVFLYHKNDKLIITDLDVEFNLTFPADECGTVTVSLLTLPSICP